MSSIKRATQPRTERGNDANDHREDPQYLERATIEEVEPQKMRLIDSRELREMKPGPARIKGLLPAIGTASIWGPSRSGKSFIALDQAFAIDAGRDWFGYRTKRAPVVYCILEGEHGVPKRVEALIKRDGEPSNVLFLVEPLDLFNAAHVDELAEIALAAGMEGGVIYIDTLNRAAIGDENGSEYGAAVLSACKRLYEAINGLVVFVHHTGKDASRGMRGHSSIFAGIDAGLEVTREHTRRAIKIGKAKDDEDGQTHDFQLDTVELGTDEDGEPITSCVVAPIDGPATTPRAKAPQGGNQKIVWDALGDLFKESKNYGVAGAPPNRAAIKLDDAIAHSKERLPLSSDRQTERANQAITGLISRGLLTHHDGWLWCL